MTLLLTFALLAAPTATAPTDFEETQYRECVTLAERDPESAITIATSWSNLKPSFLAKACHGLALANEERTALALDMLAEAAQGAEAAGDKRASRFWAQAGNAAYLEGLNDSALIALEKAVALRSLNEKQRSEVEIDRALVFHTLERYTESAAALANARALAPENGIAWLLSATLSRSSGDLVQAYEQIKTAAALLPSDPEVALEAGNIAAAAGDDAAARAQWQQVIRIGPQSPQAVTAKLRLAERDNPVPTPPAATAPDQSR